MHGDSQEEHPATAATSPHTYTGTRTSSQTSDHALLVPHDGVVDHAGDGAHGRPVGWVILEALHCDPP